MSSPSVLIVTPILRDHNGRGRVFPRALRSHLELEYDGYLDTYSILGNDNYLDGSATVSAKYQRAREVFLAGSWTHMLCIESAMILPKDTIPRLLDCEAQIAYGLYVLRHTAHRFWNAALSVEDKSLVSVSEDDGAARQAWGTISDVRGIGQGCTLIRREAVEAIPFRSWKGVSCDWPMAIDARKQGFTQRCNYGLVCGHMSLTPSPMTLWPDIDAEHFIRYEYPE